MSNFIDLLLGICSQLYDLFGMNKILFSIINEYFNSGVYPSISLLIAKFLSINNFLIIYIILLVISNLKVGTGLSQYLQKILPLPLRFISVYGAFTLIFAGLKFTINAPRPFCGGTNLEFVSIADLTGQYCYSSFPSSHIGLSVLIVYFLWRNLGFAGKLFGISFIIATGISRIILAMHYPSDIVLSIPITFFAIYLGEGLWDFVRHRIKAASADAE